MAEKTVDTEIEYRCTNKYCYIYKVPQNLTSGVPTDCHNCNLPMKKVKNV